LLWCKTNSKRYLTIRNATATGNIFVPTNYQWRDGGKGGCRRDLTLRLRTMTKEIFVEEAGEVYGYVQALTVDQPRHRHVDSMRAIHQRNVECVKPQPSSQFAYT
jgi:hypothetical protein